MDDIVVYLIFVAFALLSRFLTKKKEQPQPPSRQSEDYEMEDEYQRRPPQRQPTFEDLLKEFTGESKPQEHQPVTTVKKAKPAYKSYEDDRYEVENYEDQYQRDEEAREVYKRSVRQAKKVKTIDELVDYDTVKTKLSEEFDPYHQKPKQTIADDIRRQLQNPSEVRKAVIYAEILQRKY